jgi:hypothetical protein
MEPLKGSGFSADAETTNVALTRTIVSNKATITTTDIFFMVPPI